MPDSITHASEADYYGNFQSASERVADVVMIPKYMHVHTASFAVRLVVLYPPSSFLPGMLIQSCSAP